MQVSVTATTGLERRMTVQVPTELIEKEISTRLQSLARRVKVDGFRPGKVPLSLVQKRFGSQVRGEVMTDFVQKSFRDAVSQEKLRPAGLPQIVSSAEEPGKHLEYTAVFEIYPEFEVNVPEGEPIDKAVAQVVDEDVDKMIEKLRAQRAEWAIVDRPAVNGDRVIVDFTGSLDGQPFEGGEARQFAIILGAKRMMPGFEDQLVAAKPGDKRSFDLTFPVDYHVQKLAGKLVHFDVTVDSVAQPQLPSLDENFARSFDVADGSIDSLRKEIRSNLSREIEQAVKQQLKVKVMDALLKANPIEVPNALINEEVQQQVKQAHEHLKSRGVPEQEIHLDPTRFGSDAARRVALGLILAEIIRKNKFRAAPEQVRAHVESMAATYDDPSEVIQWYYGSRERLSGIEALVLENQAVDWFLQKAVVTERPLSFEALMQEAGPVS